MGKCGRMLLAVALLCVFPFTASRAQEVLLGIGGRVGATLDPDQVHFGVHADLGEIVENLVFRPNIEVGVGNDLTMVCLNPEVVYMLTDHKTKNYVPYAGGGLGFNLLSHRNSNPRADDDEFQVGLNLLGGLEFETSQTSSLFVEAKFGVGDSPDVKLTFGFTVRP